MAEAGPSNARTLNTKLSRKKCSSCHSSYSVSQGLVSPGTWFVRFQIERAGNSGAASGTIGNDQFPDEIVMYDYYGRSVEYELGFTEYTTRPREGFISHVTSIHRLRDYTGEPSDHYYDGMQNNGRLRPIPPNFGNNNELNFVYYFRKTFR